MCDLFGRYLFSNILSSRSRTANLYCDRISYAVLWQMTCLTTLPHCISWRIAFRVFYYFHCLQYFGIIDLPRVMEWSVSTLRESLASLLNCLSGLGSAVGLMTYYLCLIFLAVASQIMQSPSHIQSKYLGFNYLRPSICEEDRHYTFAPISNVRAYSVMIRGCLLWGRPTVGLTTHYLALTSWQSRRELLGHLTAASDCSRYL